MRSYPLPVKELNQSIPEERAPHFTAERLHSEPSPQATRGTHHLAAIINHLSASCLLPLKVRDKTLQALSPVDSYPGHFE